MLDIYRSWLYQEIPLDLFRIWGWEPFGQEKIDAAAQPQSKAEQDQAINAVVKKHDAEVKKWIEQYKGEIYVK